LAAGFERDRDEKTAGLPPTLKLANLQ